MELISLQETDDKSFFIEKNLKFLKQHCITIRKKNQKHIAGSTTDRTKRTVLNNTQFKTFYNQLQPKE